MGNIAISVEKLGKRYRIGQAAKRPENLHAAVRSFFGAPFQYLRDRLREPEPDELIWALKDVSFEVKHGEVLGIIGRNGAGKSTLLKILSRITEPTEGCAIIYGRIGSLLEVGTGFHPELTGRENVYLNGTILGMRRAEVERKFDEIVDFSGVEKFLDTPVKRYSSGMYVRLAFAVAAHLQPEVLLVDEVLAVGDAEFQKKCLGKMKDISGEGRTVLFVSHNMAAITSLCNRAMLFLQGNLQVSGNIEDVVNQYESQMLSEFYKKHSHLFPIINHEYKLAVHDVAVIVSRKNNHADLQIELALHSSERIRDAGLNIFVYTSDGFPVAKLGASLTGNAIKELVGHSRWRVECNHIDQYLTSGEYMLSLEIVILKMEPLISIDHVATFDIPKCDVYGTGVPCEYPRHGIVPLPIRLIQDS